MDCPLPPKLISAPEYARHKATAVGEPARLLNGSNFGPAELEVSKHAPCVAYGERATGVAPNGKGSDSERQGWRQLVSHDAVLCAHYASLAAAWPRCLVAASHLSLFAFSSALFSSTRLSSRRPAGPPCPRQLSGGTGCLLRAAPCPLYHRRLLPSLSFPLIDCPCPLLVCTLGRTNTMTQGGNMTGLPGCTGHSRD